MKKLRLLFVLLWMTSNLFSSPVTGLLERIDKGASSKFIIERQKSETDFFELDQKGDKVIIRGNDYVNIAYRIELVFEILCRHTSFLEWNDCKTACCFASCD